MRIVIPSKIPNVWVNVRFLRLGNWLISILPLNFLEPLPQIYHLLKKLGVNLKSNTVILTTQG